MPTYVVLLGAPGAGKGTQAVLISEKMGLPHISSGDIFRENLKNETPLGKKASEYMNRGELVPDDLTIEMIADRLSRKDCDKGAVLDGFPRTPAQAAALEEMLKKFNGKVDTVPYIDVPEEELISRLSGRIVCKECGATFHEKFKPFTGCPEGKCNGEYLYQREDDKVETVTNRIKVYLANTAPLIEFYEDKGVLARVNGDQAIDKVSVEVLAVLPEEK
ncbi:MAG: adenylate kinase [Anaerolineales bacterium]|nr:adenylate kinase [Anaerolineales bacterium]